MGVWCLTILCVLSNMYWKILAERGEESGAKRVQNNSYALYHVLRSIAPLAACIRVGGMSRKA